MRYGKAERLIQLAMEMQAARTGLTIYDIMERFAVSRRTAIRMRDAVLLAFPQADEVRLVDRRKRWRLPGSSVQKLVSVNADQLASLELAAVALEKLDLSYHAELVRGLAVKVRAFLSDTTLRQIEPDYEALVQSEIIAHRPIPLSGASAMVLERLRSAIKSCRRVRFSYAPTSEGEATSRIVAPVGLVYGHRHYLAGTLDGTDRIKFFAVGRIMDIEITNESFEIDESLGLRERVASSFGVFDEEPFPIVWKFSAQASSAASRYVFHPQQRLEPQQDGSLIVSFQAGGLLEMAWHLVQWGDQVEVVEPDRLKKLLTGIRPTWPALP